MFDFSLIFPSDAPERVTWFWDILDYLITDLKVASVPPPEKGNIVWVESESRQGEVLEVDIDKETAKIAFEIKEVSFKDLRSKSSNK